MSGRKLPTQPPAGSRKPNPPPAPPPKVNGVMLGSGKRYTISTDFDGVIHSYTTPWVKPWIIPDPPTEGAIEWLRKMASRFDVVIFSTRCKSWRGRRAMRRWLWQHDTGSVGSYAAWQDHELLGNVKFVKSKSPALIYLDDRAVRFEGPGSWPTADEIHRALPWNKR